MRIRIKHRGISTSKLSEQNTDKHNKQPILFIHQALHRYILTSTLPPNLPKYKNMATEFIREISKIDDLKTNSYQAKLLGLLVNQQVMKEE